MTVNSQNPEFGYELLSALPHAYWLHQQGRLKKTISAKDTECLYFFSPEHEINPGKRSFYNHPKAVKIPNMGIHKPFYDFTKCEFPDLKKHYKSKKIKLKKETVIICNRHNTEWGKPPINFFSLDTLKQLFELLQDDYQIVYINVEGEPDLYDNAPPISLGDFDLLKQYPKVTNFHELRKQNRYKKFSFNELQMKLFAGCEKFVTMNGGHAILASYFGGENIIMCKPGKPQAQEINKWNNEFYRWYHKIGGSRIKHVPNEIKLLETIKDLWIEKQPKINILIRTSMRPKAFYTCINSILNQKYSNINILVSYENKKTDEYITKYPVIPVKVAQVKGIKPIKDNETYGMVFSYNLYLNELQRRVNDGIIIIVDDDDKLNEGALHKIAESYKQGNELIFWKVKSDKRIIPSQTNWGKAPVCCDISGIGFAFDSKYKKNAIWEPYKRGDFRVAAKLYKTIKKRAYLNEVLSETQNGQHMGSRIESYNDNDVWCITKKGEYWKGAPHFAKNFVRKYNFKIIHESKVPEKILKK